MSQPPPPQGGQDPNWRGQPQYGGQSQGGFPQQGGYSHQGGYQQQGFQNQPPQKKRGGCMKIGLIILGVLVVIAIIIAVTSGGDDDSASVSSGSDSSESADGASGDSAGGGVEFMGKSEDDTGANAGDTITMSDIAITTSPLEPYPSDGFSEPQLCTTVTIQNNGDSAESFNPFDWTMQDPNGAARNSSFMNRSSSPDLSSGQLAPGGQTSGAICFDGDPSAVPGEYVVLYTGNVFLSDRLGWVNQF